MSVSRVDDGVAFAVRDSGIGIAKEQQAYIFEAFRQADGTTNRRFGGTGLGLSISRDLAALLGGSISVSSTPGEGSVFTLVLPLTYSPSEEDGVLPAAEPLPPVVRNVAPSVAQPAQNDVTPNVPTFADDRGMSVLGGRCVLVIEDEPQFAHILYDLALSLIHI